jgi:hypothetical protein
MGLRKERVAKVFILNYLYCRIVRAKELQSPQPEINGQAETKQKQVLRLPVVAQKIQIHCATDEDNCLQSAGGVLQGK